jgi:RNA polymerase-binding transcription factor DksA
MEAAQRKKGMEQIEVLEQELARTKERIAKLKAALETQPDYGLGEGDPEIVRWEMNQALLEQTQERETTLEQALARIQAGTYGRCANCGEPIHPDRLAVMPDTKLCIRCARAQGT